jgi:hypothetical protein
VRQGRARLPYRLTGLSGIYRDALRLGDCLLQEKVSARRPGGSERPLVLGAQGWRHGETNPPLDRLGGKQADCRLRLSLSSDKAGQPHQDLHGS